MNSKIAVILCSVLALAHGAPSPAKLSLLYGPPDPNPRVETPAPVVTLAPVTEAPETVAPETEAPETEAPLTEPPAELRVPDVPFVAPTTTPVVEVPNGLYEVPDLEPVEETPEELKVPAPPADIVELPIEPVEEVPEEIEVAAEVKAVEVPNSLYVVPDEEEPIEVVEEEEETVPEVKAVDTEDVAAMLMPFNFNFVVEDVENDLDFGHVSDSDGQTVSGRYYVALPDGRIQTVVYNAGVDGYNAEVTYEGEAVFPEASEVAELKAAEEIEEEPVEAESVDSLPPLQSLYQPPSK